MKPEKPFTDNIKQKANTLYLYMRKKRSYVTKDEISAVIGCKNERSAREVIAVLATKVPIISTSDNKGYKLALTASDAEEVLHAWRELDSRADELEKRKKPLIKFYEEARKTNG